jgi:hypothetical protein
MTSYPRRYQLAPKKQEEVFVMSDLSRSSELRVGKEIRRQKFENRNRAKKNNYRWCWGCRWEEEKRRDATVTRFEEGKIHTRGANNAKNWELLEDAEQSGDVPVVFGQNTQFGAGAAPRVGHDGGIEYPDEVRARGVLSKESRLAGFALESDDADPAGDLSGWLANNERVFDAWQSSKKGHGKRRDLEALLASATDDTSAVTIERPGKVTFLDLCELARKGDIGLMVDALGVSSHVARVVADEVLRARAEQEEGDSDSDSDADAGGFHSDEEARLVDAEGAVFVGSGNPWHSYGGRLNNDKTKVSASEFITKGPMYCPHHERSKKFMKKRKERSARTQRRSAVSSAGFRGAEDLASNKDGYLSG